MIKRIGLSCVGVALALAVVVSPVSGQIRAGLVSLTSMVAGTLPVANGGTGVTSSTGTANVVLSGSPTIVTPTIASFVNATHSHLNAAGGGTITAAAVSDLGSATVAFTNKSGNISQWTNDASYLISVTAHNLLSASHGDTTAASVVRGDLIAGQSASPLWKRLAIGSANSFVKSDGTDVSWSSGLLSIASGKTLTVSNSLTLAGTDGQTMTFPSTSATIARTDAAQTFTGSQTIAALVGPVTVTEAVGSSALTLTGATQTSSFPALNITQTWNASGTTFGAAVVNITNTASASHSALFDLQQSGVSQLRVEKGGNLVFNNGSATAGFGGGFLSFSLSGTNVFQFNTSSVQVQLSKVTIFGDLIINRSAGAVLQLGDDINGAAISQTIQAANGITGTDKTGGSLTLRSGAGTGAGAVSSYIIQTPTLGLTGTAPQTQATRLTITQTSATFVPPVLAPYVQTSLIYAAAGTALPTCNGAAEGARAAVSDATSPTYNATYTSGGAVHAAVYCNGTNWITN